MHVFRAGGESLLIGAGLGVLDAHGKLDFQYGKTSIPVDGALALAGALGSVILAADQDGLAVEARTAMIVAASHFAARKAKAWEQIRMGKSGHHGDGDLDSQDDDILAAARGLDS